MKHISTLLVVALVLSLAYVPSVHAASPDTEEPESMTALEWAVGIAGIYLIYKGIVYLIQKPQREEEARLSIVEQYAADNPDVDPRYIQAMREKKVTLGMTGEQLTLSWGEPDKINRTVGIGGVREQWIYGKTPHATYIYLDNGVVTSWQN